MAEYRSLGVRRAYEPAVFTAPLPDVPDGGARVRTVYSGLSAGTELTYLKGTDPAFTARRDPELGVFVPGSGSRRYPVLAMGYMEVAEVVESRRPDLAAGDLVAAAYGHRSHHVLAPGDVSVPVPAGLDPLLGIYLAQMGPICANGLLHATAEFGGSATSALGDGVRGRTVLVTGAGTVGLLTALFAVHHGAGDVVVADPDPGRRATATALGLQVVGEAGDSPWRECKERWVHGARDRGADLVFQCRGRTDVLHEALRSLRPQGVVIDLAFYQGGAPDLRLGEEFHHNGLTLRCAQIARVPRGFAGSWDRSRLAAGTAELLAAHAAALLAHLVTEVVPVEEGPEVLLGLARRERASAQVVFSFPD